MIEYAVNMLLAGRQRVIDIRSAVGERTFRPDRIPNRTDRRETIVLRSSMLSGSIGYIKVNDSLGDIALIEKFDQAVDAFSSSRGLIVVLTDTASGGTTTVRRRAFKTSLVIMTHGRFLESKPRVGSSCTR